ncbi:MAG TPA: cyclase family protein [Candidatus Sulfotelmatobacter sp.]|jgi:kynurenine formamidase|nr:cyclase family protein [Candidatus Sulfotelmatobacter sp.]
MKLIDLTQLFTQDMPVFPGDKKSSLKYEYDSQSDITHYAIATGTHVGTHMDGPLHMVKGGKKLSEIDLERFIANGHVIDVQGKSKIETDVLHNKDIKEGDCVLFYTGFGKDFRNANYFENYPVLTDDLARKLVELKVKFVGTDACGPDAAPYTIHRILLPNEILILENLTNLESLLNVSQFEVIALPAKFDADAAPVRVIARID